MPRPHWVAGLRATLRGLAGLHEIAPLSDDLADLRAGVVRTEMALERLHDLALVFLVAACGKQESDTAPTKKTEPAATVDWNVAAKGAVKQAASDELAKLLGRVTGKADKPVATESESGAAAQNSPPSPAETTPPASLL